MWVELMNFQAPKAVIDALQKRVDHGICGYTITPPSTGDAITEWMSSVISGILNAPGSYIVMVLFHH